MIRTFLIAALLLLYSPLAMQAQVPAGPIVDPPQGNPIVTVDFGGGTFQEYVEALRRAATRTSPDAIVNVYFADEAAAKMPLPPISVQRVHLETALEAATFSPAPDGDRVQVGRIGRMGGPNNAPIFVAALRSAQAVPPTAELRTEVFSTRQLLSTGMKAETVLTAVETTLNMEPDSGGATIRFHEPSSMLIVRGTPQQINSVHRVMQELTKAIRDQAGEAQRHELRAREVHVRKELERIYEQLIKAQVEREAILAATEEGLAKTPQDRSQMTPEQQQKALALKLNIIHHDSRMGQLKREADRLEHILTALIMQQHGMAAPTPIPHPSPVPAHGASGDQQSKEGEPAAPARR